MNVDGGWPALVADASARLGRPTEARWLVEDVAGLPLGRLLAGAAGPAPGQATRLEGLLSRRLAGEPIQHVLSRWSFRRLELAVDRRALVPRPETEVVTGHALAALEACRAHPDEGLLAVDLGTGTGAIACSLVREDAYVEVVAVDASAEACSLAAENRDRLDPPEAGRLELRQGSWCEPLADTAGRVALVVSNPPYLSNAEWEGLEAVVREFDPRPALVAGETGLEAIAAVLAGAPAQLRPGGFVVLELAPHQAEDARRLSEAAGAREATIHPDLAGRPRCLVARW